MSTTRTEILRIITDVQNDLIRLRALLADLDITDSTDAPERPRTGWRIIRGTHGINTIRDPHGTDPPPRLRGL